jgi:hypothetical protein
MHAVTVVLEPGAGGGQRAGAPTMTDILWAFADPRECLEHISGRTGQRTVRVVFFYLADSPATASRRARALCRRAIFCSPELRGWKDRSLEQGDIS